MKLKEKAQKKLDKFLLKTKEKNVDISRIKKDCLTPEWFQENYTTVEKTKLTLICPIHGEYQQTVSQFLKGKGCRKCSNAENSRKNRKRNGGNNLKPTYYNFLEKLHEIDKKYNKVYIFLLLEEDFDKLYKNQNTKFEFYCEEHGIFEMSWRQLKELRICPSCAIENRGKNRKLTYDQFIERVKENKYFNQYILPNKKWWEKNYTSQNETYMNIFCKNCNKYFKKSVNEFLKGSGCSCVGRKRKLTQKEVINNLKNIFPKYDYSKIKYKNTMTNIEIICPKHGSFFKKYNDMITQKQGCPYCAKENQRSKGEEKIEKILNKFNINFIEQYKVPNSNLKFDFYIPYHNLAFEYDGEYHFKKIPKRENQFKKTKQRDFLKNKLCHIYKINLIRIPYWDFNNLEEVLLKLLKRERVLK